MESAHNPPGDDGPSPTDGLLDVSAAMRQVRDYASLLAVEMVHWANNKPENYGSKPKIGGHQASSLSSVEILTALYMRELRAGDRLAIKPHAAPVLYALMYMMGRLSEQDMGRLREIGGPQPYPTWQKSKHFVDYTTSSEALGVSATVYDAYEARYQSDNASGLGLSSSIRSRYYAHCGDGELTEGQIDESLYDAGRWRLDNLCWVVDLNRQSLDRNMDDSGRLDAWAEAKFRGHGFEVINLRWGSKLEGFFEKGMGGEVLRDRLDGLDDQHLQLLLSVDGTLARALISGSSAPSMREQPERIELMERFLRGAPVEQSRGALLKTVLRELNDKQLWELLGDLGGHDLDVLQGAFAKAREVERRPVCIIAHTIKGHGTPMRAHPENHGMLLGDDALKAYRQKLLPGVGTGTGIFPRPTETSEAGRLLRMRVSGLFPDGSRVPVPTPELPEEIAEGTLQMAVRKSMTTGEAFQSMNLALLRTSLKPRLQFAAPDVGQTTHLGPVIRAHGVYSPNPRPHLFEWLTRERRAVFDWRETARAHFHCLGIAEGNAMLWAWAFGRQKNVGEGKAALVPVVTVYDKFFERGLNQLDYATYGGARFIAVGVPSGTGLSRETATHQSIFTPRILMDLPGITSYEPAYAEDVRAIYLWAVRHINSAEGEAVYLRLSTQPLAQPTLPGEAAEGAVRGAYWLYHPELQPRAVEGLPEGAPRVHIFATGRKVADALAASERLASEHGIDAAVLNVTSYERLWREWDAFNENVTSAEADPDADYWLNQLVPEQDTGVPLIITGDFVPSVAEWVSSALHRVRPHRFLGPRRNGEAGDLESIDRLHGMHADDIVRAATEAIRWNAESGTS